MSERAKDRNEVAKMARGDRFRFRDLLSEATYGVAARTGRLVLTITGTILGIAAVVVIIGLGQTAAGQVAKQFDAIEATQATVEPGSQQVAGKERSTAVLPDDGGARIEQINGVVAAAAFTPVDIKDLQVTAVPVVDPSAPRLATPIVVGTTAHALEAIRGHISIGRFFDQGHVDRGDRVVVLGADVAANLGISRLDSGPAIFIGDDAYAVIGIIDQLSRRDDLLGAVILPQSTAHDDFQSGPPTQIQIHIEIGAGSVVKEQAPIALNPSDPEGYTVKVPTYGSGVRDAIGSDLNTVFLALSGVALLVGGIGIANVTLLSVMERTSEIGLRRALGASRRNIAAQFLLESSIIGLLGGLIGAALGVITVVVIAMFKQWTPILSYPMVGAAATLGLIIGLLAGIYPSIKASSIEPIAALRGGE